MGKKETGNALLTDMNHEQAYFQEVTDEVAKTTKDLEKQVKSNKEDVEELIGLFRDGEIELWPTINQMTDDGKRLKENLERSRRVGLKPYFGRIIFDNESLYIGRKSISRNITEQLVIDWRAPIANAYYENGLGKMSFRTPAGDDVHIDLKLKRTFDISEGKLVDFFDSESATNDELLNKYLARNKQAVLGEIIATIQKEQNDIIRLSPKHNVIVQGVAGSGKTTVAMHRISYILYNFGDIVKPRDFYIIGSNKILLKYITGVLPELDVEGFSQMTMEDLFVRLIYEDWDRFRCRIKSLDRDDAAANAKGTSAFFDRLKEFCDKTENEYISDKDVYLDPNMYVEGLENGRSGIYDRRDNPDPRKGEPVKLLSGSAIRLYIDSHSQMSMQSKLDALNEEIRDNVETEIGIKGISYTNREKKAIRLAYDHYLGDKEFKGSIFELYEKFLDSVTDMEITGLKHYYTDLDETEPEKTENLYDSIMNREKDSDEDTDGGLKQKGKPAKASGTEKINFGRTGSGKKTGRNRSEKARILTTDYDIYDLAALAYIYRRIKETEVISEAHHIVIDEAQDYGIFAYRVLKECIRECTYTIMGDVSQNIRYDSGINDWSELRKIYLTDEKDSFMMLRKSYRNTVEISEFATKILDHGDFEVYPAEPIIRHGDEPLILKTEPDEAADVIAKQCADWQRDGLDTIAIVCRNEKEAEKLTDMLKDKTELRDSDLEHAEFGSGIMVLPVALTKGLEFDAVLIYEPSKKNYPVDNRHAKLLYVAATRALHRLTIVYTKSLTELITKPVEANKIRHVVVDERPAGPSAEELRAQEDEFRKVMDENELNSKNEILEKSSRRTAGYLNGVKNDDRKSAGSGTLTGFAGGLGKSDGYKESTVKNKAEKPASGGLKDNPKTKSEDRYKVPDFVRNAPDNILRPSGHGACSFATKWIRKEKDGVYFQSLYGITRICPVAHNVVRISFCRGMNLVLPQEKKFKKFGMTRDFQYKESSQSVEITTKSLLIRFDKYRGAFTFFDSKKNEVLKENQTEPRFVDDRRKPAVCFTNFEISSSNAFHIHSAGEANMKYINEGAYYITPGEGRVPCIIKKDRFAVIPMTESETVFCKKPVLGTFIMQEDEFSDYYLVVADSTEKLLQSYNLVTERM